MTGNTLYSTQGIRVKLIVLYISITLKIFVSRFEIVICIYVVGQPHFMN
jgi:hypothetical protein